MCLSNPLAPFVSLSSSSENTNSSTLDLFLGGCDGLYTLGGIDVSIGDDDKRPGDFARICFLAVIDGLWHLGGDDVSIGDDDMPLGDLLVSFEV